jgi:hypothetical protein
MAFGVLLLGCGDDEPNLTRSDPAASAALVASVLASFRWR